MKYFLITVAIIIAIYLGLQVSKSSSVPETPIEEGSTSSKKKMIDNEEELVESVTPKAKDDVKIEDVEMPMKITKDKPRRYTSKSGHELLYDAEGRIIKKTNKDKSMELFTYDRDGQLIDVKKVDKFYNRIPDKKPVE